MSTPASKTKTKPRSSSKKKGSRSPHSEVVVADNDVEMVEAPLTTEKVAATTSSSKRKKSSSGKKSRTSKKTEETVAKSMTETPTLDKTTTTKTTEQSTPLSPPEPQKPTVEMTVHRLRYLNYHPKPVLCIRQIQLGRDSLLAVSRDNGSVELLSARQKLRAIATVAGSFTKPVNVLAWTCRDSGSGSTGASSGRNTATNGTPGKTLIGASRDGSIFVVDFSLGRVRSVTPSAGGGIFALASLCAKKLCGDHHQKDCSRVVGAGCEDGSIRFFQVPEEDSKQLHVVSTIPSAGAAVLSLAWIKFEGHKSTGKTPASSTKESLVGSTVFVGVADGTIRRYDCLEGGVWKSTLRMTVECLGRNIATRVWTLQVLKDGTVVSGDSLGHVQFWDGHTGTMQASYDQNDNKADVLGLDVSNDECKVFASGVDSRVICIERVLPSNEEKNPLALPKKWVLTGAHRPHTHDVQAVAVYTYPKRKGNTEMLCTGGLDTKLCTYNVHAFQSQRPSTIYPWPSRSLISIAPKARVLSMMREDRIHLYELAPRPTSQLADPLAVDESNALVGTVELQSPLNLVTSSISQDGTFLAVSNASSMLVFALNYSNASNAGAAITPVRIPLELPSDTSIVAMKFATNNQLFLASSAGDFLIVRLETDDEAEEGFRASVQQTISPPEAEGEPASALSLPIDSIVFSPDRKWFAISQNSMGQNGSVHIFRQNKTESYVFWWSVPEVDKPHTAISFLPGKEVQLVVACVNYASYVFDLENRALSSWSESAGFPISKSLPVGLAHRQDYPVRIGTNPGKPDQFLMGSFGAMVVLDTSKPFPNACRHFPETHVRTKKRRRSVSVASVNSTADEPAPEESSCTICLRYNSMLYMDCIDDNEMVIVEQPWLNVVATFPEALQRKVYGT